MKVQEKYSWYHIDPIDPELFNDLRDQYHHAIQNVAAVGRMFLGEHEYDENAELSWTPGLWRLVGKWISGNEVFRSSISFQDFTIYLVNQKVSTLASLYLGGRTQNQILVWLEEQIINLNLSSSHLVMKLPYELPPFRTLKKGETFKELDVNICEKFGGHFHNAFYLFSKMKEVYPNTTDVVISPRNMEAEIHIILKETGEMATNTYLTIGYSPGSKFYEEPYFFVKSWPYVDETKLRPLKTRGFWHEEDWIGAVYLIRNLWDSEEQESTAHYFLEDAIDQVTRLLID